MNKILTAISASLLLIAPAKAQQNDTDLIEIYVNQYLPVCETIVGIGVATGSGDAIERFILDYAKKKELTVSDINFMTVVCMSFLEGIEYSKHKKIS